MELVFGIAWKSFIVAGAALLLLRLASGRSAAERSSIAHLGLIATLLLPVAALALPPLEVEGPGFMAPVREAAQTALPNIPAAATIQEGVAAAPAGFPEAAAGAAPSIDWAFWLYAAPAALLVLLTLIALGRLFLLQARARVLVEPIWLTALARAQQRMGFKHGTALLISDELPSPISWGLVRPVILLNARAAEAADEAEAIIAHELAHVARLDWLKLLLARVTTALYWFNPLVWVLAREAHQLREEAADDTVLAADIVDTDYAELLVGIARHECRGLLIGAHGVAPSKGSLARRIARVLDPASRRGPAARGFALGVFVGATAIAAPLAALTLVPAGATADPAADASEDETYYASRTGSGAGAAEGAAVAGPNAAGSTPEQLVEIERDLAKERARAWDGKGPQPGTVGPRGALVARDPAGRIIEARAVGVTPEYVRSIRSASPRLSDVSSDDLVALRAVGVTPAYIQDLARQGYPGLGADELVAARALGIDGSYIRGLASAGVRGVTMDDLVEMKALGVTPDYVREQKRNGYHNLTPDQLVELRAVTGHGPDLDLDIDLDSDHGPDDP